MGGRSGPPIIRPRSPSPDDGAGDEDRCPKKIQASITGPSDEIVEGSWLEVQLDKTTETPRVVVFDDATSSIVGALTGVPNLALLMKCLEAGVEYLAYVEGVDGGRIDVILAKQ